MAVKQHRLMITISDENLKMLEKVHERSGVSKSSQIQALIAKYLEKDYHRILKDLEDGAK
jgi:metal-responsive CopG/Arc/MetJ family transcriptional regulator